MSTRTDLAAALADMLPELDVRPQEDMPDKPSRPTLIVRHRDYTPAPNSQGIILAGFTLTLVSIHADESKAEDQLETILPDLWAALRDLRYITWSRAQKVLVKNQWTGYDVETSVPIETPPE